MAYDEAQSVQYVTYSKMIKITHFSIVLYVRNYFLYSHIYTYFIN